MNSRNIKIAFFTLVSAVVGIVVFYLYTKAVVAPENWSYTCFYKGCNYELEVTNRSEKPRLVYVRINAFGVSGVGKISSQNVIATDRREFHFEPGQKMKISGFVGAATKPQQLSYGVGVVGE